MIATYCNILQQLYKYRKYQISITLCLPHCLLCLHFDMDVLVAASCQTKKELTLLLKECYLYGPWLFTDGSVFS